jgi:hypothetical protein
MSTPRASCCRLTGGLEHDTVCAVRALVLLFGLAACARPNSGPPEAAPIAGEAPRETLAREAPPAAVWSADDLDVTAVWDAEELDYGRDLVVDLRKKGERAGSAELVSFAQAVDDLLTAALTRQLSKTQVMARYQLLGAGLTDPLDEETSFELDDLRALFRRARLPDN